MAGNTPRLPQFLHDSLQYGTEETENGYKLNSIYLPEEVILHILSFVEPNELLNYSLVCRTWNKLIKSYALWSTLYKLKYHSKPKQLPWYLFYCLLTTDYFNNNLIKNGNGQERFKHWRIVHQTVNSFVIETSPVQADPLPLNVPEFYNHTSCFATSAPYFQYQPIELGKNGLFQYILNTYKPHIYLSEWTAGSINCGCIFQLRCAFVGDDRFKGKTSVTTLVRAWEGWKWNKVEMTITDYPDDIRSLGFEHEGYEMPCWDFGFRNKFAGGVLKLLFDSIEPLPLDENGREKAKIFSEIKRKTNFESEEAFLEYVLYSMDYETAERLRMEVNAIVGLL